MPARQLDARMLGKEGGVLADEFLVDMRLAVIAALERRLGESFDLTGREPKATVASHGLDERIEDLGHGEDLLLADAEQVVVERAAHDDRLGRVVQAGRAIDDDRGIARSGHDGPPLAGKRGAGDGGAPRDDQ